MDCIEFKIENEHLFGLGIEVLNWMKKNDNVEEYIKSLIKSETKEDVITKDNIEYSLECINWERKEIRKFVSDNNFDINLLEKYKHIDLQDYLYLVI